MRKGLQLPTHEGFQEMKWRDMEKDKVRDFDKQENEEDA